MATLSGVYTLGFVDMFGERIQDADTCRWVKSGKVNRRKERGLGTVAHTCNPSTLGG